MARGTKVWRELYDAAAEESDWWRAHRWGYSGEVAARTVADIAAKLRVGPGDRVLEVGCGSGMVLSTILQNGQRGFGVDLSEKLIRRAAAFGVDRTRLDLLAAEAAGLPFRDGVFDRVLCYSVFQCFPDRGYARRALRELVRVCKPGGMILVGDVFGAVETMKAAWADGRGRELFRRVLGLPWMEPLRVASAPVRWGLARARAGRGIRGDGDDSVRRLHYTRGFFRRVAASSGCHAEILPQQIAGRESLSCLRFDVRLSPCRE